MTVEFYAVTCHVNYSDISDKPIDGGPVDRR